MSPPPELVVLSDVSSTRSQMSSHPGYRFVEVRRLRSRDEESAAEPQRSVLGLFADLPDTELEECFNRLALGLVYQVGV